MSIPIFGLRSKDEYQYSRMMCSKLINNIQNQTVEYLFDSAKADQASSEILKLKKACMKQTEEQVRQNMQTEQNRAIDIAQMKGASSWLSALPLDEEKFNLNKREFSDTV